MNNKKLKIDKSLIRELKKEKTIKEKKEKVKESAKNLLVFNESSISLPKKVVYKEPDGDLKIINTLTKTGNPTRRSKKQSIILNNNDTTNFISIPTSSRKTLIKSKPELFINQDMINYFENRMRIGNKIKELKDEKQKIEASRIKDKFEKLSEIQNKISNLEKEAEPNDNIYNLFKNNYSTFELLNKKYKTGIEWGYRVRNLYYVNHKY